MSYVVAGNPFTNVLEAAAEAWKVLTNDPEKMGKWIDSEFSTPSELYERIGKTAFKSSVDALAYLFFKDFTMMVSFGSNDDMLRDIFNTTVLR